MGGRSKPPKRNKKLERLQMKLMEQQLKNARKKVRVPHISIPEPAPLAPQAQGSSGDAVAAAQQSRRAAAGRRGNQSSILAGETGGFLGGSSGSSILG